MKPITMRRIVDIAIFGITYATIAAGSDNWFLGLIIVPFGLWNFYDGQTRGDLQ